MLRTHSGFWCTFFTVNLFISVFMSAATYYPRPSDPSSYEAKYQYVCLLMILFWTGWSFYVCRLMKDRALRMIYYIALFLMLYMWLAVSHAL